MMVPKPPAKPPKAKKAVKRVNVKRRKSEFARCYGSRQRVAFVKSLPCAVNLGCSHWGIENVHIETGGVSRKSSDDKILPLCEVHHRQLHIIGRESFERIYGIILEEAARRTENRWQSHVSPVPT